MLDEPTQFSELLGLERRVHFGGRETVDHPQISGAHDDAINALAGCAVICGSERQRMLISPEVMARAADPFRQRIGMQRISASRGMRLAARYNR
jgi:hypothetical protein